MFEGEVRQIFQTSKKRRCSASFQDEASLRDEHAALAQNVGVQAVVLRIADDLTLDKFHQYLEFFSASTRTKQLKDYKFIIHVNWAILTPFSPWYLSQIGLVVVSIATVEPDLEELLGALEEVWTYRN